jgi:hypothetical protein
MLDGVLLKSEVVPQQVISYIRAFQISETPVWHFGLGKSRL